MDIKISGLLVNDVETNSYTNVWHIGSLWFKGEVEKDYGIVASSILTLFNTLMHEAGHHMSRMYNSGPGGTQQANSPMKGGDNMDLGFEAPTWERRVGGARDMWEGTKNFSTRLIWPDGNINAMIVPPIGRLQPKAIRDYFYPPNWQSASRETAMILETKSPGPLPTGNNDPDIIPSNNPSNVIIITPEASKSKLEVKKPID